jgi:negative regulator of flagellin synthesis FlgM
MKITNSTEIFTKDPLTGKSTTASPSKTVEPQSANSGTSATLSSLGGTLATLQTELAQPTFDESKVDEIKQAIRDGKFQVNADAVADKLIASAQDVLARRPQN